MAGFGGDMAGERMSQSVGAKLVERRHSGGRDKAVEQDRNVLPPRRKRRAENGGKLAAAKRCGDAQRIVQDRGVTGERAIDHGALSLQAIMVNAGAAAGPARAAAAEQSAAASAAAAVVLPMPISPRQTRSLSGETAS